MFPPPLTAIQSHKVPTAQPASVHEAAHSRGQHQGAASQPEKHFQSGISFTAQEPCEEACL